MKYIRHIVTALIFCFFLALGLWLFAPWETIGRYAMDKIRLGAAQNGMFISYADFGESGTIFPTYAVRSLDIDQGMAKFTLAEASVKVLPISSLLFGGMSCHISFVGGEGVMIPDSKLKLEAGNLKLSVSGSTIAVANTNVTGELEATGKLSINRKQGRVTTSTLTLRVPQTIDNLLKNPVLSGKLHEYFEPVSNGEWRVKQNATPNS